MKYLLFFLSFFLVYPFRGNSQSNELEILIRSFLPDVDNMGTKASGIKKSKNGISIVAHKESVIGCFSTDNRGFSSSENVTSRLETRFRVVSNNGNFTLLPNKNPTTVGITKKINCDNGDVLETKRGDTSIDTITYKKSKDGNVIINGRVSSPNPLVKVTPNIDYQYIIEWNTSQNTVYIDIAYDAFPAYEMYVRTVGGDWQTVFNRRPIGSPFSLIDIFEKRHLFTISLFDENDVGRKPNSVSEIDVSKNDSTFSENQNNPPKQDSNESENERAIRMRNETLDFLHKQRKMAEDFLYPDIEDNDRFEHTSSINIYSHKNKERTGKNKRVVIEPDKSTISDIRRNTSTEVRLDLEGVDIFDDIPVNESLYDNKLNLKSYISDPFSSEMYLRKFIRVPKYFNQKNVLNGSEVKFIEIEKSQLNRIFKEDYTNHLIIEEGFPSKKYLDALKKNIEKKVNYFRPNNEVLVVDSIDYNNSNILFLAHSDWKKDRESVVEIIKSFANEESTISIEAFIFNIREEEINMKYIQLNYILNLKDKNIKINLISKTFPLIIIQ